MRGLRDSAFVVVDTETTGGRPDEDRIIEVAAVRVEGGEIVDRFSRLVNPGRAVPRRIAELTGISTAMLFDKPQITEVLPAFREFLGEGIVVAHNLPFDWRFLHAELGRAGLAELENDSACTLRLARRLLPGLPSKGLDALADFYKLTRPGRHRALVDAEITAEVLLRFLDQLEGVHGVRSVEELLVFQNRRYRDLKKQARHLGRIREEVLPTLPERPGVYFMHDRKQNLLYIGKAKRLRSRVRSYFTAIEAHPERIRKLVEQVREITWQETGSELEALLLESRLIKERQPRFNRAQRRYRSRPFIRLDTAHPFPRVSTTTYLLNDGAEYFGPLGGRGQADLVMDLLERFFQLRACENDEVRRGRRCLYADLGRCTAPCEGGAAASAYAAEVERVRAFLTGADRSVLGRLESEMREAAGRLAFEEAAQLRDWMRRLERLLDRQRSIATPVLAHNAVVFTPGVDGETLQFFLVRFGRHVETVNCARPLTTEDEARLAGRIVAHFGGEHPGPERYFKEEADEIRILSHWLYTYRRRAGIVPIGPGMPAEAFARSVVEAARRPAGPPSARAGGGDREMRPKLTE